jgi:outer membrane protein TolC
METPVRLTGTLNLEPVEEGSAERSVERALATRADLKAQQRREETARLNHSSVRLERAPTAAAFADYGAIGSGLTDSFSTRTYGVALRIPLYDGGRRDARRGESRSQYEQERIRTADLRRQIELDVRRALDELASAREQVEVAAEGLTQVEAEVEQARRRYAAGVAGSLEVTDAQTRLARARDNRIAALFLYSRARLDLWGALGTIRSELR